MPTSPSLPTFQELTRAIPRRDITRPHLSPATHLPPQDPVLQARGGDYATYEEVLRDDQVASTFQQRRLAVTSTDWEVRPGHDDPASRHAAAFLEQTLHRIGWDAVTDKMLFGVFYGFAVAECLWERDKEMVQLREIKVRKQRRFAFAQDHSLLLRLPDRPQGEPLPPCKFWHFRTGTDNDDEPYGLGLAHWLFWPVYFKRNGLRMWLTFLDKFGMPTARGTYPANATEEEKQRLLSALQAIQTDAGIIIPEGMDIELIEAARAGHVNYETFLDRMNAAIAKVVLSQTLTTEAVGGQYKGDVQKAVRNEVVKADADLVCDSFNRSVVRWLTQWNFPNATPPRVWRRVSDEPDMKPRAERDKLLFDMGFTPSLEYVRATYGGDWNARTSA